MKHDNNIHVQQMLHALERKAKQRRGNACLFAGFVLTFVCWLAAVFAVVSWNGFN